MSWQEIKSAFNALREARDTGAPLDDAWAHFAAAARETESAPPYHFKLVLDTLRDLYGDRPRSDLDILDHGCGSGLPILFLIALGYTSARGVNITPHCLAWNEPLQTLFDDETQRFFQYDGSRLPFDDASVDLVFSQQVLEHVHDGVIDAFYEEEGRIIRPQGVAVHQVPHRLVPFESHSRTWLVHWLPKPVQIPIYRCLRVNMHSIEFDLFLRGPGFHLRQVQNHIGPTENVTHKRLKSLQDLQYYDGPRRLRRLIAGLSVFPLLGSVFSYAFARLMMLETVSVKR